MQSTTIGSSAGGNSAQIAALQKQLAQYEKQLQTDEAKGGKASAASTQLVTTEITLVETEISQLSKATVAGASTGSALGNNIDVTA